MRNFISSIALAATLPLVPAQAATLFAENFDGAALGNYSTGTKVGQFNVTQNDVDIFGKPGQYYCPDNSEHSYCLDLNGNQNGQIATDLLSLAANTTYTVLFEAAGNGGQPYSPSPTNPYTFTASFGGTSKSYAVVSGSANATFSFNVTTGAAPTNSALIFTSTSVNQPTYWGAVLDNIRITSPDATAPVPEPASWAMMVVGFGTLGAALRRRRSTGLLPA